jgi:methylated-DNA-[protein]-cysteine S-methyltransferase
MTAPADVTDSPEATLAARVVLAAVAPTPAGDLNLVVRDDGTVLAAGYGPLDDLVMRWRLSGQSATAAVEIRRVDLDALPASVVDALRRYADDEIGALDGVPVEQPGGGFYQAAWEAMRRIPPGTTVTYTELAAMAGRPAAVRAAGTACARNLVAPFVPCHRIVRTDGSLGGYAYGLEAKKALLAHEKRVRACE